MAEYKVTINATPSKAKAISVSPKNVNHSITATPDSSLYFSNLSKQWAIKMDGMVNGEDYSSKYNAKVAAENAQISQTNAQACEDARVLLQGEYNEYSEGLNSAFEGLESEANAIVSAGKTDIQNTVTSAKNTAISAIQTQQTTSVNAVKTEGTTQVNLAKAQATAAANSATQASNVVKQVEDDLDSKVDIDDMVEVDFVEVPTIVEVSDPSLMPSWYRVYSDGWCEMAGTTAFPSTVTFLKEFKDVNYTTLFSLTSLSTEGYEAVVIYDKTTTSMKIKQLVKNYTGQADWYACGYIKQGD